MSRYLPIALGVFVIFGLTAVQFRMTDRLSAANVTAEQRAVLLKNVPDKIGDWHGEDMPVDPTIQERAGAVGAVSRVYRNVRTGEVVDLWLIVGHARSIVGHTPDICYPSSGFEKRASENSLHPIVVRGQPEDFFTNTFFKEDVTGRRLVRVFWAWYDSQAKDSEGVVEWKAPENARFHFGNSRALYKMYFTAEMRDQMETAEQSPCLRFAQECLPVVNRALAAVHAEADDQADEAAQSLAPPVAEVPETPAEPVVEIETDLDEPITPAAELLDDLFDTDTPVE